MPVVIIGNTAPITVDPDADPVDPSPESRHAVELDNGRKDNHTITDFAVPDGVSLLEAVATVRAGYRFHSDDPPAFVVSDDPVLQMVLAQEFGCPTEPPRGFKAKGMLGMTEEKSSD